MTTTRSLLAGLLLVLCLAGGPAVAGDPVSFKDGKRTWTYEKLTIHGWTVYLQLSIAKDVALKKKIEATWHAAGLPTHEDLRLLAEGLPIQNIFGTVFYTMAGLHALHVVGGALLLSYVIVRAVRGKYHQYQRIGIDLALYYWLLVVVVWVFFFVILYLL